jgi:hypothetical protein
VYWAGSMFMFRVSGFGIVLAAIPALVRTPLLVADAIFCGMFFAVLLHFAITFPTERRGLWEVVPYVAALPISIETLANNFVRVRGEVRPVALGLKDWYSTAGTYMLMAALAILIVRLVRVRDANTRRRLQLIFLSMFPASAAFILGYLFALLRLGHAWEVAARMAHVPATMLGSGIFTYAVVRHRMFNIRVLVRRLLPRMVVSGLGGMRRAPRAGSGDGFDRRTRPTARPRDADVEGSATEVDDPRRLP